MGGGGVLGGVAEGGSNRAEEVYLVAGKWVRKRIKKKINYFGEKKN